MVLWLTHVFEDVDDYFCILYAANEVLDQEACTFDKSQCWPSTALICVCTFR